MVCQPCDGHTYRANLNFNTKVLDFVQFGGPVFAVQTILISGAAISPNYAFGQLGHCCQVNDTCDRVFIK